MKRAAVAVVFFLLIFIFF